MAWEEERRARLRGEKAPPDFMPLAFVVCTAWKRSEERGLARRHSTLEDGHTLIFSHYMFLKLLSKFSYYTVIV